MQCCTWLIGEKTGLSQNYMLPMVSADEQDLLKIIFGLNL